MEIAGRERGLSLLELAVGMAIVAILAAVALPAYQEHAARGRRAEGQSMLLKASQRMRVFHSERNTFTTDVTDLGYPAPAVSPGGLYQLAVAAPTVACPIASCYVLQAAPLGNHAGDRCGTLTYSSTGTPGSQGNASCW